MDIQTGNILIADFLGIKKTDLWGGGFLYNVDWYEKLPLNKSIPVGDKKRGIQSTLLKYKPEELVFHSSWDWLMPIIVKIKDGYLGEELHEKDCEMYDAIETALKDLELNTLWQMVVRYIQWYNTQTK